VKRERPPYRFGRSLKPFRRPWLWAGLWSALVAVVVVASLVPTRDLPQTLPGIDKFEHFLAYFALAAGAVQLFAKRLALLSVCVALALLGIGLEQAQAAMALGRQMDQHDALANTLGVLAGLATQLTRWRDLLLRFDTRPDRV
jgi:VanZ family protein